MIFCLIINKIICTTFILVSIFTYFQRQCINREFIYLEITHHHCFEYVVLHSFWHDITWSIVPQWLCVHFSSKCDSNTYKPLNLLWVNIFEKYPVSLSFDWCFMFWGIWRRYKWKNLSKANQLQPFNQEMQLVL